MKKTLVALALAVTTVSGSAMAWTANGTGSSLELGGTLTPKAVVTPWEVLVGMAVNNLNADIKSGTKVVDIPVTNSITVLGIRTQTNQAFNGMPGISPKIDFNGAIETTKFVGGYTPLTLDVNDNTGAKIGTLTAKLGAAAMGSVKGTDIADRYARLTVQAGSAFEGGLPAPDGAFLVRDGHAFLNTVNPAFLANIDTQGMDISTTGFYSSFDTPTATFSAAYGSGIKAGEKINLTLDAPAANDAIVWKASLPVTVSYQ